MFSARSGGIAQFLAKMTVSPPSMGLVFCIIFDHSCMWVIFLFGEGHLNFTRIIRYQQSCHFS